MPPPSPPPPEPQRPAPAPRSRPRPGFQRSAATVAVVAAAALVAATARLLVGAGELGLPADATTWGLRLSGVAAAAGVGAGLALAGVLLQSLLRNPLAAPDLLGLSGGAGLAVSLAVLIAGRAASVSLDAAGLSVAPALVGSLAALALVYALGQRGGLIEPTEMVLAGVVIGIIFGAATVFVQHLMPDRGQSVQRWLLGVVPSDGRWRPVVTLWSCVLGVFLPALLSARAMDAAAMTDDEARSVGVPLAALRSGQFLGAGVLTAACVGLAGPIGFVGLIAPHMARRIVGPRHGTLLPVAALAGAAMLLAADAAVHAVRLPTGRLPVGVLTAALGGPVFLMMLRSQRRTA